MREALTRKAVIDSELQKRISAENPCTYGLPDLLRIQQPDESPEQFCARQNKELRSFIQNQLWILKDSRKLIIKLNPQMVDFLSDMFYRRANQAILWKGRGTGGSLCSAILIWMSLIYHKMSFTAMAGSSEQAKQIYQYTKSFWNCFPDLARSVLQEDPLMGETRFKNGVMLKIISASEKQARGKHNAGFIVDESCQSADNTDQLISAAMQGAMSEPNFMVVVLSTFHHPIGLFQEIWDFADERGFKRYTWDVYDSMVQCVEGLDEATTEDPKALHFCQTQCYLTEKQALYGEDGVCQGERFTGCNGKSRCSDGFLPRKNVLIAKKMNRGTNVFAVEYENQRPNWMRPVYDVEWIERSEVAPEWPGEEAEIAEISIGIDWGLQGQTAMVLAAMLRPKKVGSVLAPSSFPRCVAILESDFMTGKLTPEAIRIITNWAEKYPIRPDKFFVYADASGQYNNLEVSNAGFDIRPVNFQKWKDYGIGNVIKFFTNKNRFFMRSHLTGFIEQLKRYRQDKMGKPIKKDDHGPDALLCAMLHFQFEDRFKEDLELTEEEEHGSAPPKSLRPSFEGMVPPTNQVRSDLHIPITEIPVIRPRKSSDGQVVVL